jgi:hypothetical protein
MAVKARETLESKQINMLTLVILIVVIITYTVLYNQIASRLENYQLKTLVGVISLLIMMGGFLISLRYITTIFEMVLTHDRLIIERKIFFWKKTVLEIRTETITAILPLDKAKKIEGHMKNYTLASLDGKRKYVVQFEEQGKICCAKIQCSGKFYDSLKKQVKI